MKRHLLACGVSTLSVFMVFLTWKPVYGEDTCPEYNDNAKKCRTNGCAFVCGDRRCNKLDECGILNLERPACQDKCFDLCWCKKYGDCEYDGATGGCRPAADKRVCNTENFPASKCLRDGAYNAQGGVLCLNEAQKNNCSIAETVKAVNFGGPAFTDSHGIKYLADSSDLYADHNKIRKTRKQVKAIEGVGEQDKPLYQTFLYGDEKKAKSQWCTSYFVELTKDGDYELVVKLADDEEDKPGERKFTILFGEAAVFPEIDIRYLAQKPYKPVDIIVNFEVYNQATILVIDGHRDIDINQNDHRVWLSFCYSTCQDTANRAFLAAGFQVNRFGVKTYVSKFCFGPGPQTCEGKQFEGDECGRAGHYYSFGGTICQNTKLRGDCGVEEVVRAINFGGPEVTDSRGIKYSKDEKSLAVDLFQIRRVKLPNGQVEGVPAEDKLLYNSYIVSDPNKVNNGYCVSYPIDLREDGVYELALRLADDEESESGKRKFNVLFGEQTIFPEIDIRHLAGGKFKAANLAVNFMVNSNASYLVMNGHPDISISEDHRVYLAFCYSTCPVPNRNFLVAGFSVIKLGKPPVVDKFCTRPPPKTCDSKMFEKDACARPGGVYSHGGNFCVNAEARGNCFIENQIKAINLGDYSDTWDSRDIYYAADLDKSAYADHFRVRDSRDAQKTIVPANSIDRNLYRKFLTGEASMVNTGHCLSYHVSICQDGSYELALRLADDREAKEGIRKFSVLFGERNVFPAIDISQLGGKDHKSVDLYINFVVTDGGTKLKMKGFDDITIPPNDKRIWLAFCFGTCDVKNKRFLVGAFSVVKFGPAPSKKGIFCSKHLNNPCACRSTSYCEYEISTGKCIGKHRPCTYTCEKTTECRRANSQYKHIYYADGGVVCQNLEQRGNCQLKKTMIGVNFNAPDHTDINGIEFKNHKKFSYEDPYKELTARERKTGDNVPKQDKTLYQNFIYGKTEGNKDAYKGCVTYYVPIDGDGNYELSIKTGEYWYYEAGYRDFNYVFNGQTIVAEFDPAIYRSYNFDFDLNVNFKVMNKGTSLQMRGYKVTQIPSPNDKLIKLQFCHGQCTGKWRKDKKIDINWEVGAFSVVKFME